MGRLARAASKKTKLDFDAIPIGAGSSADVDVEIDDEEMAAPKRRVAPRNGTWRLR